MAKRKGKVPTLICSSNGSASYAQVQRKRTCKRCDGDIVGNLWCAEIKKAGTFGSKVFCLPCFGQILDKTETDLAALRAELAIKSL